MDFSRTRFWVRLFGVPLTMRNTGNSEKMGALLGELQEVDIREEEGAYFCMRVELDLVN